MKLSECNKKEKKKDPAAFGRLRVETDLARIPGPKGFSQPPSGGCVLKPPVLIVISNS